jgi:adenylate cyclase
MAKLVIFGSDGRREVDLSEHNSVGRLPQNDIQVLDRIVSKEHCIIHLDVERGYVFKDLGSLNGSFVNKAKISGEVQLSDGDEVFLGNTRCMFISEDSGATVAQQVVDMTEGGIQSHIRSKISAVEDRFLPEAEIEDVKDLRTDYEKLRVTYELQHDIGLDLTLSQILDRILDRTFEFLNCDRGVILLADEIGKMKPQAFKMKKPEDKLNISSTLVNAVQAEKAGILSSDAQMDNRFKEAKSMIMQGIRSSMAVPILHADDLLGIILIDSSVAVNAYSEKDLHLLSNIANQTAQFIRNADMTKKIEVDAATRERFSRLLSPDLAEMVVSGELSVEKGGEDRVATVLFADIRGFTSMSENMAAAVVLQMLNEYFEVMVEVAFKHEGTIDKFVGDEIMVLWGAPVVHEDDPGRAVSAGLDMQKALVEFNCTREDEGLPSIEIGIGVNTGPLVAGYIGSTRTMSYSVIGDTVNTAARLCSTAKSGQVLISEHTYDCVKGDFDFLKHDDVKVKGKMKPVRNYQALGYKNLDSTELTRPHKITVSRKPD